MGRGEVLSVIVAVRTGVRAGNPTDRSRFAIFGKWQRAHGRAPRVELWKPPKRLGDSGESPDELGPVIGAQ
jgi:hypothetical protein